LTPKSKEHDDKRIPHHKVHKHMNTYNTSLRFISFHFTQLTLSYLTLTYLRETIW